MASSSWLIGSYESLPSESLSVTAGASTEGVSLATGSYYVIDPTSSVSLAAALEAALESHSNISTATVTLRENGLINVTCDTAFTLNWPAGSIAQTMLGFTGNLSPSATSHLASLQSTYVWAADRNEIADARLGTDGWDVTDTVVGMSGTSNMVATRQNVIKVNEFRWRAVVGNSVGGSRNLVWSTSDNNYEFRQFWLTTISRFRQFKMYREINYSNVSSTDTDIANQTPLGPYKYRNQGQVSLEDALDRTIPNVEKYWNIRLPVVQVQEYS